MRMRHNVLVAALAAAAATAALATVGCEQRSAGNPSGSVGSAAPSTDKMQAQSGTPSGTDQGTDKMQAQSGTPSGTDQSADKMQAKQPQAVEETQKQATNADDTAITAKVKAAIMADPSLKGVDVDTKNATVTLSGSVGSDMLRDRAKQIAMGTEGVRNVVDNLSIRAS